MADHTPYQKKIINRYYDRRGEIMLTRLQEIASELYLADAPRKQDRLWLRAASAMKALKIPATLAEHILARRDPAILAKNLRDWLGSAAKPPR